MATVYIIEQGATISKNNTHLVIEKDDKIIGSVPYFQIDALCIFGNVQITTQAIAYLMGNGIEATLCTMDGRIKGQIVPIGAKNNILRIKQYEIARDEKRSLSIAISLVKAKLKNALYLIKTARSNYPEIPVKNYELRITEVMDKIPFVMDMNSLRGLEGFATHQYFLALTNIIFPPFKFEARDRRPPQDPVNALLSFGYTLLMNEILFRLQASGFDPYIGFYHSLDYARPSLALDLMEPYRHPIIDRFTVTLLNKHMMVIDNFVNTTDNGCRLTPEGLKNYFEKYEGWMRQKTGSGTMPRKELAVESSPWDYLGGAQLEGWRTIIQRQIDRVRLHLLENKPFESFSEG